MLVEAFLIHLPDGTRSASPGAESVIRFARRNRYTLIPGRATVALLGSGDPGTRQGGVFLRVLPGTSGSSLGSQTEGLENDAKASDAWASRRLRLYNLLDVRPEMIRVSGDLLGLLRYYHAQVDGGMVISSSIHALLSCFPDLVRPHDPLALAEFVLGGTPAQDRTLHARVRASSAGRVVAWEWGKAPAIVSGNRLEFPSIDSDISPGAAIDLLTSRLSQSITESVADPTRIVLPITGGYDSRWIACAAREDGIAMRTVTLGLRHHREVQVARALASMLELPHAVLRPSMDAAGLTELWRSTSEGQAGWGTVFVSELLNRGFPAGTTVLSGYQGGVLFSGAVNRAGKREFTDPEQCAGIIADRMLRGVTREFGELLQLDCSWEALRDAALPCLPSTKVPRHAATAWYLEQERGVAAQLPYLGREYHVGLPFCDPEFMQAWLSLPRIALEERRLLQILFAEKWPQVASLPHAQKVPTALPRGWTPTRHLLGRLGAWSGEALQKRFFPERRQRLHRGDIWNTWHGASTGERRRWQASYEADAAVVREVLGWKPPPSGDPPLWDRLTDSGSRRPRIQRAFHLLGVYCRWLRDTIPAAEEDV